MAKFSIIIPHKNSFSLLVRCIESIPNRSDVEIIIVDDCSDSNIVSKKDLLGLRREKVEIVLLPESRGAGYARNVGIEHASGEWLIFSDCDDFFEKNFDKVLNDFADSSDDIIFFNVKCVDENTLLETTNLSFEYYKKNINLALETGDTKPLRYCMNPPWGKFVKKSLVENYKIKFDELPVANDLMFSLLTGFYANKVSVSSIYLYNWVISSGSLSTLRSLDKCNCHLDVAIRKNHFLSEHDLDIYRVNLFKMMKLYKGKGFIDIIRTFIRVIKKTKSSLIFQDLQSAIQSYFK